MGLGDLTSRELTPEQTAYISAVAYYSLKKDKNYGSSNVKPIKTIVVRHKDLKFECDALELQRQIQKELGMELIQKYVGIFKNTLKHRMQCDYVGPNKRGRAASQAFEALNVAHENTIDEYEASTGYVVGSPKAKDVGDAIGKDISDTISEKNYTSAFSLDATRDLYKVDDEGEVLPPDISKPVVMVAPDEVDPQSSNQGDG